MNNKEVGEIRRRFTSEKTNIRKVHCCYVSSAGETSPVFELSMATMPEDEQEKVLKLLKKSISGNIGRTLTDISFSTGQVVDSDEHRLLMKLKKSFLNNKEAVEELCGKIASTVRLDSAYIIMLAAESYDVPHKGKDGSTQYDEGDTQFSYYVCGVYPLKETKPCLKYVAGTNKVVNQGIDYVVSSPELGFMFPSFDDRCSNIYGALYYVKDERASYDAFFDTVFHVEELPVAVAVQKENFCDALTETLEEQCSAEVVQKVHRQLQDLVAIHQETHNPEPLFVTPEDVSNIIRNSGVSDDHHNAFKKKYDELFGKNSTIAPQNLLGEKLEYKLPDVTIRVAADHKDLIESRIIGGVPYLMIKAEDGVEINGVSVKP